MRLIRFAASALLVCAMGSLDRDFDRALTRGLSWVDPMPPRRPSAPNWLVVLTVLAIGYALFKACAADRIMPACGSLLGRRDGLPSRAPSSILGPASNL